MSKKIVAFILKNQILAALLFVVIAWLVYQLKTVLIEVFISYILMAALLPLSTQLQKKGANKTLSIAFSYLLFITVIVVIIFPLVPFLLNQIISLMLKFPSYVTQVGNMFNVPVDLGQVRFFIASRLDTISVNAFAVTSSLFSALFATITVFVVSFYMAITRDKFITVIVDAFPQENKQKVRAALFRIEEKLGFWVRGQLFLSLCIGIASWIALSIIGVDFALPLAVLAGILEVAPTIGPILSAIPAVIVAFTMSPTTAVIVALVYVGIQIAENNILVPRIMERAVGLNPLIVILAVLVGGQLLGVVGALLSVPFVSLATVIYSSIQKAA